MMPLLQDLRYAARKLRGEPAFSAVVAATIAIGVGATTVIFSVVNALLIRPLPVHEPDRLIQVAEVREAGDPRRTLSYPHVLEYRDGAERVARLGAYGFGELAIRAGDDAGVAVAAFVTGDFFDILGITPALGRFFTAADETPRVPAPIAVISHGLWRRHFGGDPDVIGGTVRLNGRPLTVIGVAPEGFHGIMTGFATDIWTPIPTYAVLNPGSNIDDPDRHSWLTLFGRLQPGVDARAAEAVLAAIGRGIAERSTRGRGTTGVEVAPLTGVPREALPAVRLVLSLLLATAGLVLLIACVNVAGMLLARASTRRREVGIRLALGAGRRRLIAQLLTESTFLFLIGGAGGILLTFWLTDALAALASRLPGEFASFRLDAAPDLRVVLFGLALAFGTGILFGLVPALRASRADVVADLKDSATGGPSRLRAAFVVGQVAVSLVLLLCAGLLVRSFQGALAVDTGMDASGVVVGTVNLEAHGYDAARSRLFFDELAERLRARPHVEAVAFALQVPLTFNQNVYGVRIPGHRPPDDRETFTIDFNVVDPEYFRLLRIPVEGRGFTPADGPDAPAVAVVNRTMARRFWPDGDAIGQRMEVGVVEVEIVGIAGDGKYHSLAEAPIPYLYRPFAQSRASAAKVHVRAEGPTGEVVAMIRGDLRELDADVPLISPGSLEELIRITLLPHRIGATVVGAFGALGLLLAAIGLYGVLAYTVGRQTREISVRLAVGAMTGDVLRMVLRQGGVLLLAGMAVGLPFALAATRLLESLLFDISPADPPTFLAVSLVFAAVALLACYIPARRATRVDPMIALRTE